MEILPITNQANKPTFEAVIPKYLKQAQKEYRQIKGASGEIFYCLSTDVYFKQISKQDGIDTMNAIRPYVTGAKEYFDHIFEFISNLDP